jgi:hypothetical protein
MSATFTSVVINGGREPSPGKSNSYQNPDLWVKGGAIIGRGLNVEGNLESSLISVGTIEELIDGEGIDVYGDVRFFGNIIGGNISGGGGGMGVSSFSAGTTGLLPNTPTLGPVVLSGTLTVPNGGTGLSATPANGQVLIGNGTGYTLSNMSSGTGVSVLNGAGTITLTNTGVTGVSSGTGISASASTGAITLTNTGVTGVSAGAFMTISGSTGVVTIASTGPVASVAGGTGISASASTGAITLTNTGVTGLSSGTGISASSSTGTVTLINTGVTGLSAGAFMTISGSTGVVTIASTGPVASITGGTGISASGSTGAITLTNTGVTGISAGTGISANSSTGVVTLSNVGVRTLTAGTAISVSGSTGAITVTNTGVTGLNAGSGIGVSASTGTVTVNNTGVLSLGAGAGIVLSGATGAVTISTDLVMDDSADPRYPQTTSGGVWYGNNTKANVNSRSVALGNEASATGEGCVAVGNGAVAQKRTGGVSIGYFANVQEDWAVAVGAEATVSGTAGIVIGHAASTKYPQTMAFGQEASVVDEAHPIAFRVTRNELKRDAIGYSVNGDVAVQQRNTALGLVYDTDNGDLNLTDVGPGVVMLIGRTSARIILQDTKDFSVGSCLEIWNLSSDIQSIRSFSGASLCALEREDPGVRLGEAAKFVLQDPVTDTWVYRKFRTDL